MIDRKLSDTVLKEAALYPVITILGPRQAKFAIILGNSQSQKKGKTK